jgi:hypothetical protein
MKEKKKKYTDRLVSNGYINKINYNKRSYYYKNDEDCFGSYNPCPLPSVEKDRD